LIVCPRRDAALQPPRMRAGFVLCFGFRFNDQRRLFFNVAICRSGSKVGLPGGCFRQVVKANLSSSAGATAEKPAENVVLTK
jgi:hypothetical protein